MIIKIAVFWEVMTVYSRRMLPAFRRNLLPKTSGQKSNSRGKTRVQTYEIKEGNGPGFYTYYYSFCYHEEGGNSFLRNVSNMLL
jgi:hypothetical protein